MVSILFGFDIEMENPIENELKSHKVLLLSFPSGLQYSKNFRFATEFCTVTQSNFDSILQMWHSIFPFVYNSDVGVLVHCHCFPVASYFPFGGNCCCHNPLSHYLNYLLVETEFGFGWSNRECNENVSISNKVRLLELVSVYEQSVCIYMMTLLDSIKRDAMHINVRRLATK